MIGRYRRKRDKLVDRSSAARIPTMWGPFTAYCYRSILDGIEHIAMVKVSSVTEILYCKFDVCHNLLVLHNKLARILVPLDLKDNKCNRCI